MPLMVMMCLGPRDLSSEFGAAVAQRSYVCAHVNGASFLSRGKFNRLLLRVLQLITRVVSQGESILLESG
jgi:hypothetical protein